MMVVVVLIGIMLMTVSAFWADVESTRSESATRDVVSMLEYARDRADSRDEFHYIIYDAPSDSLGVYTRGASGMQVVNDVFTGEPLVISFGAASVPTHAQTKLADIHLGGYSLLAFDSDGVPRGSDAAGDNAAELRTTCGYTVQCADHAYRIEVKPITGLVEYQ